MEDLLTAYIDRLIGNTGPDEGTAAASDRGISIRAYSASFGECALSFSHACYELIYVHSGDTDMYFGEEGEIFRLSGGSFVFTGPCTTHSIRTAVPETRLIRIFIGPDLFQGAFLYMIPAHPDIPAFFQPSRTGTEGLKQVWTCGADGISAAARGYLTNLLQESLEPDAYSLHVMLLNLAGLFWELSRLRGASGKYVRPLRPVFSLSDVLIYLNDHLADATLQETAAFFDYSPRHFSLRIKKACGLTFSGLLKDLRLTRVALLLETTSAPAREILARCGYQNTTYFYKIFEEKYGTTPAEYRQEHRNDFPGSGNDSGHLHTLL